MIRFVFFSVLSIGSFASAHSSATPPLMGRTSGNFPYLEYGFGYDRLGGAKITNLDTGIVMKVVDSTAINYKVQLSNNHFAFLPKSNFTKDESLKPSEYYLASSWLASGDDRYDYVRILLDEKLPYRSIQQVNPSRLVIDIYGATSNTNWVNQLSSAKEVRNISYEQTEDDVYRVTIELNNFQHWGYKIYYEGKRLVVRIRRQPADLKLDKMKVVVDAGHGGSNPGASGVASRIIEKNYTLMIAKALEAELIEEKAAVFMTRTGDITLGMNERIRMAEEQEPDFLISIHLNSSSKDSIKGASTYYRHYGFKPLSVFILKQLTEIGLAEFGNIGNFNFALSGPTEYPNCLVEVAFLSNRDDEKLILDTSFHRKVAKAIVEGIKDWLKYCRD